MCYSILQVAANTLKQELILAAVVEYTIHRVYIYIYIYRDVGDRRTHILQNATGEN